ncbi:MAG: hypothetical protein N3F09_10785 [Bacteroidia bacterium]|nr:hypothetical protein [Bacteroidia bacterium]
MNKEIKGFEPFEVNLPQPLDDIYFKPLMHYHEYENQTIHIVTDEPQNPRLDYVCRFIFHQHLGIPFKLIDYEQYENDYKNYHREALVLEYAEYKALNNSIFIKKDGWLNQTKVPEKTVEDYVYFPDFTDIVQKDFFSFIFYHISRYEEWACTERDGHGRFEARHSLLQKKGLLEYPIVNIAINKFREILKESGLNIHKMLHPKFSKFLTLDIDNGYAYLGKGWLRTIGATGKDLLQGKFKMIAERIRVISGLKNDPFDVYEMLHKKCLEHQIQLMYFVLTSDRKPYNRFLQKGNIHRKHLFATLLKHSTIPPGLHPSYEATDEPELYLKEFHELEAHAGNYSFVTRHHYLRFEIKSTPEHLLKYRIKADFSMGFAEKQGFRAGTWSPFPYFNFHKNKPEGLWLIPFCLMDGNYFIYSKLKTNDAIFNMKNVLNTIKQEKGVACVVFHERTMDDQIVPDYKLLVDFFIKHT